MEYLRVKTFHWSLTGQSQAMANAPHLLIVSHLLRRNLNRSQCLLAGERTGQRSQITLLAYFVWLLRGGLHLAHEQSSSFLLARKERPFAQPQPAVLPAAEPAGSSGNTPPEPWGDGTDGLQACSGPRPAQTERFERQHARLLTPTLRLPFTQQRSLFLNSSPSANTGFREKIPTTFQNIGTHQRP